MLKLSRGLIAILITVACSGDGTGPKPTPGPLHDPEVFFHFDYVKDSTGQWLIESHPDTAVLYWYRESDEVLLAQATITGFDSLCGYFLLPEADTAAMIIRLGWKYDGVTNISAALGPYHPTAPADWGPYFDIGAYRDATTGTTSFGASSSNDTSMCPAGMKRDSINVN